MRNRLEELAHLFSQGEQPPHTLDELIAVSFGNYPRWGRKHAYQRLIQLFDINDSAHRDALLSYFTKQPQQRIYRPPGMPASITDQMLQPALLRFLAENAPADLQEWVIHSKESAFFPPMGPNSPYLSRQTQPRWNAQLLTHLAPLYPGLAAHGTSQQWMTCVLQSHMQAQKYIPPETEIASLMERLKVSIRKVRQSGYHWLWRRGTPSLLALKEAMQHLPAYQPGKFPRGIMAPPDPKRFLSREERYQVLIGMLMGRLMFRSASREQTRISMLREILTFPANDATWHALCVFLNNWCQHEEFPSDIVYPYVTDHLQSWSDDLRLAPRSWWAFERSPRKRPWSIIRRIEMGDIPLLGNHYARKLAPYHRTNIQALLVQSEPISHCTQLFLQGCRMGNKAWSLLLQQLHLCKLQALNLDSNALSPSLLQQTVKSPYLRTLQYLSFRFNKPASESEAGLIANIRKDNPEIQHIFI